MHATQLIERAPPYTAAEFQSVTTGSDGFSHTTPAGTFRCLIVIVHWDGNDSDIAAVTYGGTAMSKAITRKNISGVERGVSIWYLLDPAEGAGVVDVSYSSIDTLRIAALSFQHVNPDTPILGSGSATGSSPSPSVNTSSVPHPCIGVAGLTCDSSSAPIAVAGAGTITERYDLTAGVPGDDIAYWGADRTTFPVSGNIPMAATLSAASGWAMAAIALLGAPQ